MQNRFLKILLVIAAVFYAFEAVLHGFGLSVLEHDKIFLPTHDRYIAIFALTYAALAVLIATDVKKYRHLFFVLMAGIALSTANAALIAAGGGYAGFGTVTLDADLTGIGIGAIIWYLAAALAYWRKW